MTPAPISTAPADTPILAYWWNSDEAEFCPPEVARRHEGEWIVHDVVVDAPTHWLALPAIN